MTHDGTLSIATEAAQLDELLDTVKSKYEVRFEPLTVGDVTLEFLQISDMVALVERLSEERAKEDLSCRFGPGFGPPPFFCPIICAGWSP